MTDEFCLCQSDLNLFYDVLSLVCVDPKYLNWSTSSDIFAFIHMCLLADDLGLMLLARILLLLEQI